MFSRSLPKLDGKRVSALRSETELACKLLTGDESLEDQQPPSAVPAQQEAKAEKSKNRNSTLGNADTKILGAMCVHHKYERQM